MSVELSTTEKEQFAALIQAIHLQDIQVLDVHYRKSRLGDLNEKEKSEAKISWQQSFSQNDPLSLDDNVIVFRPKYNFSLKSNEEEFFHLTMITIVRFKIKDKQVFESALGLEPVKKFFYEKQILKIMYPLLRQHVIDSMSRLSISPFTLPLVI
ncbi:MAG: hypothetical protein JXK07_00750 [Spirochaetes bacterium]|nr:hypothetical protein [Spirochaetota bacterium]MBN2770264.1 hypothetical protein [Spirochaetota bacterium]